MKLESVLVLSFLMLLGDAGADPAADYARGLALQSAEATAPDPAAAREAFEKAAAKGHTLAALQLGMMHANGSGGPRDDARAYHYFSEAAAAGQREARYNQGLFLLKGRGVPRDVPAAILSLSAAASEGSLPAHIQLADLFYFGTDGLKPDRARALPHVKASATAGDAWACNILGTMAEYGQAMPVDRNAALHWFSVAAQKGNAKAQGNLGSLLRTVDPTAEGKVKAYLWLKLASLQGNTMATYLLNDHQLGMSADQIAEGDRAVEEFKKNPAADSSASSSPSSFR